MKKILYLFLVLPLIFSSCKKEEEDNTPTTTVSGCMDPQAINYNSNATQDDCACLYDIVGVWETTSALLNGQDIFSGNYSMELHYLWDNGDIGFELYDMSGGMNAYGLGSASLVSQSPCNPNVIDWSGTVYSSTNPSGDGASMTISIDYITNVNNMTWHYVDYPSAGDTYVKTLVRSSTYTLSDW
tara:strand:- start:469 stop:1023 length:555 start_codon:yes stop_codon:yes gene_type:complete